MFASLGGDRVPAQFGMPGRRVNFSEFSYERDEQIFGESEPADYVYQVTLGAVRSYKLLLDGRRQIGAFHLVGDIFGLGERFGSPLYGRGDRPHQGPFGKASKSGTHSEAGRSGRTRSVGHHQCQPSACPRPHVAAGTQNCVGAGCCLSIGDGQAISDRRVFCTSHEPTRYRGLSGTYPGDCFPGTSPTQRSRRSGISELQPTPDRPSGPRSAHQIGIVASGQCPSIIAIVERGWIARLQIASAQGTD